jgi:hypothetical protein
MSSWSTMRKATEDDERKVAEAAARFAARHGIDTTILGALSAVQAATEPRRDATLHENVRASRLRKLWRPILERACGSPDGIAYGYVGRSVQ